MAIGVDQIYLSMTSPDTGEYMTANVYTVDGVYEADGVTLRRLSIGQLVMALCLKRATDLESGYSYVNPETGETKHVDGVIDMMGKVEDTSGQLECMTEIENAVLESEVDMKSKKVKYNNVEYTYYDFLTNVMELDNVPSTADKDSQEFLESLESKMDELNSFSQETMIKLQSATTKRDQTYDMISNILKSFSTVLTATVNNV